MNGKFTIQQMLWATLAFGFVAMAMTAAYRGNVVAFGVLIAPLFMAVTFGVLAVVYWLSYVVCHVLHTSIHTPAAADFSGTPQAIDKQPASSRYATPTAPANSDAFKGDPE